MMKQVKGCAWKQNLFVNVLNLSLIRMLNYFTRTCQPPLRLPILKKRNSRFVKEKGISACLIKRKWPNMIYNVVAAKGN